MQEYWEFPGGKVHQDETPDDALRRELKEELGINVQDLRFFQTLEHDYPDLAVRLDFYIVSEWQETPVGCEGQQICWVAKDKLCQAQLLPADVPVIDIIRNNL